LSHSRHHQIASGRRKAEAAPRPYLGVRRHAISDQPPLLTSTSAIKAGATPAGIPSLFEIAFLLGRESRFRLHFKKPSEASVFADVFDGTLLDSDAADNLAV
jgi:hypothetical protein